MLGGSIVGPLPLGGLGWRLGAANGVAHGDSVL